jgi:RNA polymerase sigma factor (sigma-70 family)
VTFTVVGSLIEDGQDLLQDVLLQLLGEASFDPSLPDALAYARQRLRWRLLSIARASKRASHPTTGVGTGDAEPINPNAVEPWVLAAVAEARERTQLVLRKLDEPSRSIVNMHLAGMTFGEISDTMNIAVGVTATRFYRALHMLRETLCDEPLPE